MAGVVMNLEVKGDCWVGGELEVNLYLVAARSGKTEERHEMSNSRMSCSVVLPDNSEKICEALGDVKQICDWQKVAFDSINATPETKDFAQITGQTEMNGNKKVVVSLCRCGSRMPGFCLQLYKAGF